MIVKLYILVIQENTSLNIGGKERESLTQASILELYA